MPDRMPPSRRGSLNRRSSLLTAGVLFVILLLVWSGGYFALRTISESKERELELRLEALGQLEAQHLSEMTSLDLLSLAIPEQWPSEESEAEDVSASHFLNLYAEPVSRLLDMLVSRGQLRRAMVVDIHRRAIADSAGRAEPFLPYEFLDMDRYEIERARQEDRSIATPYYAVQEEPYKRSYTPLKDSSGRIVGFLQLEASRGYFAEMEKLRPQLFSLMAVITVLVLLVGLLFHRLLLYALKAETAAAEADRLHAVGTLAAGFAHEIRNPLGIIRSYAEGMAEELAPNHGEFRQMADEMVEEVVRVNELIGQFLNFARPDNTAAWELLPVSEILQSVVRLIRKELESKQISVTLSIADDLATVWGEEKSLRQVFLNVLLNARDACDSGGAIRIDAQTRRDKVVVRFEDNGKGIAPADLSRVFEPFFTNKASGTGLGLSVSRNIVEQFGGTISIRSQSGQGTSVEISLPVGKE